MFPQGWCAEVSRFAPQAIAGTLAQLETIASTDIAVSHAIIVVGGWEDRRVTEADRERLWARYRVPLFEQIVGEHGALLAAECEAHWGLHLVGTQPSEVAATAGTIDASQIIDASPCGCGKTSPRILTREHAGARAAGL